jgi:hypothetical protein
VEEADTVLCVVSEGNANAVEFEIVDDWFDISSFAYGIDEMSNVMIVKNRR